MTFEKLYRKLTDIKSNLKKTGVKLSDVTVEVAVPADGDPEGCLTGIDLGFEFGNLTIYPVCGWKEDD